MKPKNEKSTNPERMYKYAVFYPQHQGYFFQKRLGDDGTATLLRGVNDACLYVRRKREPDEWESKHDHQRNEIKYYRDVPGVQKRIYWEVFRHLDKAACHAAKKDKSYDLYKSLATIWPYCNGVNLAKFMHRRERGVDSDKDLEVFIWHVFSRLLQAYDNLYKKGSVHRDGYNHNIFLHFEGEATFPEVYLCDFKGASKLDYHGVGTDMALLFINIRHLMNRTSYYITDESKRDCSFPAANGKPAPGFTPDLTTCVERLGVLALSGLGDFEDVEHDIEEPEESLDLRGLRDSVHELRVWVEKYAAKTRSAANPLPNMSCLRTDNKELDLKLYESRADLFQDNMHHSDRETAGPWRIARVDSSGAIAAVEKTDFNLHEPDLAPHPYNEFSRYKAAEVRGYVGSSEIIRDAVEQDQAGDDNIVHPTFEIDPYWDTARLYSNYMGTKAPADKKQKALAKKGAGKGKSPSKKGKTPTPKKPAGVSKRGAKKQKQTKPQVKGARQSRRVGGKGPEEKYKEGL